MVNEISISNYKSILHQQITLGQVNVFIGANGSGKTNILEAVGMAAAAHDDALAVDSLIGRGIRVAKPALTFHSSNLLPQKTEIEIAWRERRTWKKTKLVCDHPEDVYTSWTDISWKEPEYIDKLNDLIKFVGDGAADELYPFSDESKNTMLNAVFRGSRNFRDYLIYNINTLALRGYASQSRKEPLGIFGEGLDLLLSTFDEEQIQMLKSGTLVPWLDDIGFSANTDLELRQGASKLYFKDKYMQKENNLFPAENLNGGALYALFYMALFISKRTPSFFAIDNIETLLDPDMCKKMMETIIPLAAKHNKQVLITTHHQAIADGLDLSDQKQKLFRVNRTDNGQTLIEEVVANLQKGS